MVEKEVKASGNRGVWRFRTLATSLGLLALMQASPASAGLGRRINGLFSDSVDYSILVTNESGRPLAGATIWVLSNDESRQDIRNEDLSRLVKRYATDVDLVFASSLHSNLLVLRTDPGGVAHWRMEGGIGDLKHIESHFAGFKRGYKTAVVSDDAPVDSTRNISLRLARDNDARVDVRLEEFDGLRALMTRQIDKRIDDKLAASLKNTGARMREIAGDLEREGSRDAAALLYFNLANLPSVDIVKDESGNVVSRGYTNGFDARAAERIADRRRAWQLNTQHPQLEFQALEDKYSSGLVDLTSDRDSSVRRAFLAETEKLLDLHGDRMWPGTFATLWRVYNAEGKFSDGCKALQRYQAFEPSTFASRDWRYLLDIFRDDVKLRGGAPIDCELAGLAR